MTAPENFFQSRDVSYQPFVESIGKSIFLFDINDELNVASNILKTLSLKVV